VIEETAQGVMMTETVEALIKRTMVLEDRYYDLQAKYQELIHEHEELKERYEKASS
jgi:predicted nuclease with TOPRIM domain